MTKKKKNVSVIKNGDKLTVRFDPMFYVTAARRETPPPTKVEMPKKGKGSYNRKEKHKRSCHSENDGNSFLYAHKIIYSMRFVRGRLIIVLQKQLLTVPCYCQLASC